MFFHFPTRPESIHSLKVAGRLQFFIQNWHHYSRAMGLTGHSGLRSRTAGPPLAVQNPFSPGTVASRDPASGRGDKKSSTKRSYFRGTFYPQCGILQQSLSCDKEGRSWPTSDNQSRKLQQVCDILPLQNGRLENSFRPSETRGFHVQTGPEGCIFHHPSPCQVS